MFNIKIDDIKKSEIANTEIRLYNTTKNINFVNISCLIRERELSCRLIPLLQVLILRFKPIRVRYNPIEIFIYRSNADSGHRYPITSLHGSIQNTDYINT